jgi:hypothetical protein
MKTRAKKMSATLSIEASAKGSVVALTIAGLPAAANVK